MLAKALNKYRLVLLPRGVWSCFVYFLFTKCPTLFFFFHTKILIYSFLIKLLDINQKIVYTSFINLLRNKNGTRNTRFTLWI